MEQLTNLRAMGAILESSKSPVIKKIDSRLNIEEIEKLKEYNVIVATPQALQHFSVEELDLLASQCSHLIFDEAHHVAASTWSRIRKAFGAKPTIQFTATPFREDKKTIDGKIIYNYSLRQAQLDGYFQEIEFHPIREYNLEISDEAIASKAIDLLRQDLADGKNHLMMVRAKSQARAHKLFKIYQKHNDISSVLIHSNVRNKEKILADIKAKKFRIIVCVDMLGEGFDLPELKIAAIHDQHQTPAVTLQFIGRMTRGSLSLGTAKFVANIANQKMSSQMAALYKESANWSEIIREVSENKIKREVQRDEFTSQFDNDEEGKFILALNPVPNISAIAYELSESNWRPESVEEFSALHEELIFSSVNSSRNLVIMVTRATVAVSWASTSEICDTKWCFYMGYYNRSEQTMFVHCSGDEGQAKKFRSLISKNSNRIIGEKTFRTLHELNFLKLQNVGLTRNQKDIIFTMHVGRDINAIIGDLENGTAIKSNIFATGFSNGIKTTAGCSYKGKIWEMDSGGIDEWIKWCDKSAIKLNDENIETKNIINNVMRSEKIETWPMGIFYADWPDSISIEAEQRILLISQLATYSLLDITLGLPSRISDLEIKIPINFTDIDNKITVVGGVKMFLGHDRFSVDCGNLKISLEGGRSLSDYLEEHPLRMLKQDGSFILGNYRLYSPATINILLPLSNISVWDWGITKIQNESMGPGRDLDTVQGFTYGQIVEEYDIIFNDDGAGEIADLVAIKELNGAIHVSFFHCKYCGANDGVAKPGGRVADTYEVSGQTSRSAKWLNSGVALFSQLVSRYQKSISLGFDRILKGTIKELDLLRSKSQDRELILEFYLIQPAISQKKITTEQLAVLGTTYTYIKSVSGKDVHVVISK